MITTFHLLGACNLGLICNGRILNCAVTGNNFMNIKLNHKYLGK